MTILIIWVCITVFHAILWLRGEPARWSSVFWLSVGLLSELVSQYSENSL